MRRVIRVLYGDGSPRTVWTLLTYTVGVALLVAMWLVDARLTLGEVTSVCALMFVTMCAIATRYGG